MFEPWKVETTIRVEDVYGTEPMVIPNKFRGIAFRPPLKGEVYLGVDCSVCYGYSYKRDQTTPRIILAPALTEIEEWYGEGATPESVWAKYCPDPSKYGKPRFGSPPVGHEIGYITYPPCAWGRSVVRGHGWLPRIYALPLNEWQQLYGEEITDAKALEAKLRAEGKLGEHQFIEAELKPIDRDLWFVSKDPDICILRSYGPFTERPFRAIVGTRKRGYIRIPYEAFVKYLQAPMCAEVPTLLPGSEVVFYGVKGTYVEE